MKFLKAAFRGSGDSNQKATSGSAVVPSEPGDSNVKVAWANSPAESPSPSPSPSRVSRMVTVKKRMKFTLLDIVEDGVRVRFLNVWAFMLIYVFLVFGMLNISKDVEPVITQIDISTPLPHFRSSGPMDEVLAVLEDQPIVTPKVVMYDQNGNAMRGAKACMDVVDFESDGPVDCSMTKSAERRNTLSEINFKDVCAYELSGSESSEAAGLSAVASFGNFQIDGPTGVYTLQVTSGKATAEPNQRVAIITPVSEMWVVDTESDENMDPPSFLTIGTLLNPQPAVLLLDSSGLPLANRTVTVFPNPDPTWPPTGQNAQAPPTYGQRGQKSTELECATSEPSDSNGLAKFTCLKVVGSTVDHINWVFSESGLIFYPWNDPVTSPNVLYPFSPIVFRPPTYLDSAKVYTVYAFNKTYTNITEGVVIDPPPTVIALDRNKNPVSGVACYAMINQWSGQIFPLSFPRERRGIKRKELYNVKATTNSEGIAVWDNLTLSVQGNILYEEGLREDRDTSMKISYVCDGIFDNSSVFDANIQEVWSTVETVEIKRWTSTSAYLTSYDFGDNYNSSTLFTAVVQVRDKNKKGVPGKNVIVEPQYTDSGFVVKNVASTAEATGDSGFAVVSFVMVLAPEALSTKGSTTFQVRFSVDGTMSELSKDLTVRTEASSVNGTGICNMLSVGNIQPVTEGSAWWTDDAKEQLPWINSGSLVKVWLTMSGQTLGSCTHFPELAGWDVNLTTCGKGRRLSQEEEDAELLQQYEETDMNVRKLESMSSDGSIMVSVSPAYSDDGDVNCEGCERQVPHLPEDFLDVRILDGVKPPTLAELSAKPGAFPVSLMALGATGDHFLKFKVTVPSSDGVKGFECETPPVQIRILNPAESIWVDGDNSSASALFDTWVLPDTFLKLNVHVERAWGMDFKLGERTYKLADSKYQEDGIYWKWVEYPLRYSNFFFDSSTLVPANETEYWSITELDAEGNPVAQGQGWNVSAEQLPIGIRIKKPGMFGRFALQFGVAGLWSDVVTFTIDEPWDLKVELVQEPAHTPLSSDGYAPTLTPLSQQPVVRVTADGQPLEGAVVLAEFLPDEGTLYTRLVDVDGFDPVGIMYSNPSNDDGIANFSGLAMLDAWGCGTFRFGFASEYEEEVFVESSSRICFGNVFSFEIISQPPLSMPLDMPLSSVSSSAPITVEAQLDGDQMPPLACPQDNEGFRKVCPENGLGLLSVRVVVAEVGGVELTREKAESAAATMLEEQVCVWVNMVELNGRCSNLTLVQTEPKVVLQFQILSLKWKRITKYPANMKLMVTDLSGSDFLWQVDGPSDLSTVDPDMCLDSLLDGYILKNRYVSQQIQAETSVATTEVVLSPPITAFVGQAFLVRVQLFTKSGSPVEGKLVRACLASVGATDPSKASPSFLHSLTKRSGFTSSTVCSTDAYLAASSALRRSNSQGIASFPLIIQAAASGTYVVHFQAEEPGATISATSSKIRVFNDIGSVTSEEGGWGTLQISEFGKSVEVRRKPVFRVEPYDLAYLEDYYGMANEVTLVVRAVSTKQAEAKKALAADRKRSAEASAAEAKEKRASLLQAVAAANLSYLITAQAEEESKGVFQMLSGDYASTCLATRASTIASGDSKANLNETEVQETSMSDEVMFDKDIVDPAAMLNTFVGTFSSGGAEMTSAHDAQPVLMLTLSLANLTSVDEKVFTLKDPFYMNFQPGFEYRVAIRINGVESEWDEFPPFKVEVEPLPIQDIVFNWCMNFLSVLLACILLITNTRKHHRAWFGVALLATIGVLVAVPSLEGKDDAMGGYWKWVAMLNLGLVALSLAFGLLCEVIPNMPFFQPFETKRQRILEEYTARRWRELLRGEEPPAAKPSLKATLCEMVKPFSNKTAFYYPSGFFTAVVIGLSSFVYVIIWIVSVRQSVDAKLEALKQKAISALVRQMVSIGQQFYKASNQDLPDKANDFMYKQLELVSSWFDQLVAAVELALTIAIAVSTVIAVSGMVFTLYDFRSKTLGMRQGHRYGYSVNLEGGISFAGCFITSLFVGFALIALLLTVLILPLLWPLTWNSIWSQKWAIVILVVPMLLQTVIQIVAKRLAFGADHFKNRGVASILQFWQVYTSLLAGVAASTTRLIKGLVGLLIRLPTVSLPVGSNDEYTASFARDPQYQAYLSSILTHHILNGPVFATAAKRLWNVCLARKHFKERGMHWTSTRSLVILLLIRFPLLKRWRKAAIAARQEKAEQEKEKEKEEKDKGKTSSKAATDTTSKQSSAPPPPPVSR